MNTSADPIAMAADAALLLSSGRTSMALTVLERLPVALQAALTQAHGIGYIQGQADAHRVVAAARQVSHNQAQQAPTMPPAPRTPNRLDLLREALADPTRRQLVKAALRMDDRMLSRVAAGGATLSREQWRRLREVLA